MKKIILSAVATVLIGCGFVVLPAHAGQPVEQYDLTVSQYCKGDTQKKAELELKKMWLADQKEREPFEYGKVPQRDVSKFWRKLSKRDLKRRERVAELFAQGCFKTADDYYEAALVYQHGDVPDHFFQAYIWASKAAALGNKGARWLRAADMDRYLEYSGYKQVYATQAFGQGLGGCNCLWPVVPSSSENFLHAAGVRTVSEQFKWLDQFNKTTLQKSCLPAQFCTTPAKDVPDSFLQWIKSSPNL